MAPSLDLPQVVDLMNFRVEYVSPRPLFMSRSGRASQRELLNKQDEGLFIASTLSSASIDNLKAFAIALYSATVTRTSKAVTY